MGSPASRRQWIHPLQDTTVADEARQAIFRRRPEAVAEPDRAEHERRWSDFHKYPRRAEVSEVTHLTDTGTIAVTLRDLGDNALDFEPGQFIGFAVEVGDKLHTRPYCLASTAADWPLLRLVVRLIPEGSFSQSLKALSPGDVLPFRGPLGRSMLPEGPGSLVLIATGVGVGPYLGLVRHLAQQGEDRPVRLYWGLRLASDICLTDELDALAREHPDFAYRISLSQPPPGWQGLTGRVTESVPPLLNSLADSHFVLCGNGAMIAELHGALYEAGVPRQQLHREFYFNTRYRPDEATVAAIRERFAAADVTSPLSVWHTLGIDLDTGHPRSHNPAG